MTTTTPSRSKLAEAITIPGAYEAAPTTSRAIRPRAAVGDQMPTGPRTLDGESREFRSKSSGARSCRRVICESNLSLPSGSAPRSCVPQGERWPKIRPVVDLIVDDSSRDVLDQLSLEADAAMNRPSKMRATMPVLSSPVWSHKAGSRLDRMLRTKPRRCESTYAMQLCSCRIANGR